MPALPVPLKAYLRRNAEPLIFTAFWILNIIGFLILPFDRGEQIYNKTNYATMPLGIVLEISTKAVFLYLHVNWLMMQYLVKRRYGRYALLTIGLIVLFTAAETVVEYYLVPGYYPNSAPPSWPVVLSWNLPAYGLEFMIYSYIYGFVKAWILNEKQKKELTEEKLQTELAFLKAQVNPHFLFNTLNNLFSMAHMDDSPATANGILKLSQLMRYMLHESNVDRISLEKEINYIRNYIELERMRFSDEEDDIVITFEVKPASGLAALPDTAALEISPMLLIPYVENAFKHGLTLQGECRIHITLEVGTQHVRLLVQNTVNRLRQGNIEKSGLGLGNARRRLELLYPGRHTLHITETENLFTVELEINL